MTSATIEFRTLGALDLRDPSGAEIGSVLARPKDLAVLAYLAASTPFGPHRRDTLLPLFWPSSDERRARGALSQTLHRLRRDLGADVIRSRGKEDVGVSDRALRVDVRAFEELLDEGDRAEAMRLYRGAFLEGLHVPGARGFERWMDARQTELRRRAVAASVGLAESAAREGNPLGAARWLRVALEASPLDEAVLRRLILTLSEGGDRTGAIRTYEEFADRMRQEYALEPAEATRALVDAIRGGERPVAPPDPLRSGEETPTRRGPRTPFARGAEPDSIRASRPPVRALAVLPFRDLPEGEDRTIVAQGMTEALVEALGRIAALRVLSRPGAGRGADAPAIAALARELDVDAVVTGSVERAFDRLHIRVRLVGARPEEPLWAEAYHRAIGDVPAVHAEVAREIARAVEVRLSGEERRRLTGTGSVDPAAYEAYLKGRHFMLIPGAVDRAVEHFREATRRDPAFAAPYAGLAFAFCNLIIFGYVDPDEAGPPARRALDQALALDPGSSEAHTARGLALTLLDRDWENTERELRHAVRVNPSSSVAWAYLGGFLASMGWYDEARSAAREAAALDPTGPWTNFIRAWTWYRSRRLEEAAEAFRETLELYPQIAVCHGFLSAIHFLRERADEAVEELERGLQEDPTDQILLGYGASVLGRLGRTARARELRERLEAMGEERYVEPYYLAAARLGLDDRDGALAELEKVVEAAGVAFLLNTDPLFDPLREEPRFEALVEKLGFPPPPSTR